MNYVLHVWKKSQDSKLKEKIQENNSKAFSSRSNKFNGKKKFGFQRKNSSKKSLLK